MPDHNPYGEPLPSGTPVLRDKDRGPDPRPHVINTLKMVGSWEHIDFSEIVEDIRLMRPEDKTCACCGYEECEAVCPMLRWRGQA